MVIYLVINQFLITSEQQFTSVQKSRRDYMFIARDVYAFLAIPKGLYVYSSKQGQEFPLNPEGIVC